MNTKLRSADMNTLQGAFDICHELFLKTPSMDGKRALLEACEIFNQAMKDLDKEMEAHRIQALTAPAERARRTWNDYVDSHCEKMTDADDFEMNVPDSSEVK